MKKLIFATRHMQDRPFTLGGRTFFSRLLNGSEEIDLTELDSLREVTLKRSDSLRNEAAVAQRLLQVRRRDKGEDNDVALDWVIEHLGPASAKRLTSYLRAGETLKPGETLDCQVLDEPLEIEDRTFVPRTTTYNEQIQAAETIEKLQEAAADAPSDEDLLAEVTTLDQARDYVTNQMQQAREMNRASADILAGWLNARKAEGAELISAEWLLERLQLSDVALISTYLTTGELPPEEEDPKAGEGDGE